MHPLVAAVLEHLGQKPDATCYPALLEALTGIWNAAVRGAVVSRLRAAGLPPDDLLLLCSDGLTEVLTDERIAEVMRDGDP